MTAVTRKLHDLSAAEMAGAVRSREVDPVDLVGSSLARIEGHELEVRAWAYVDVAGAKREAEARSREAAAGTFRGPLHGVPVGIKDVFHVAGMPTVANSRTMDGEARYPDSGVAAALRAAGAVILGKTETVEFAGMGIPPATRNPWNPTCTAGGSSSGSGAAVGARMVPAAIGTQTGGSNLRPAAYCGVAGLKPTYGALSRAGVLPVSWSLDHPGIIARSAADLALIFQAIAKVPAAPVAGPSPWRVGLVRQFFLERSAAPVVAAIESAVAKLGAAGAVVSEVALPPLFDAQQAMHRLMMSTEMATYHAPRVAEQPENMTPRHRLSVEAFSLVPANYYLQALRARRLLKDQLAALFDSVDILAMPTTPDGAPEGLTSTGDASLLSPWSLVGFPAATVPCGLSPSGMPLGLQLVGKPGADMTVVAAAAFAESLLGRLALPLE